MNKPQAISAVSCYPFFFSQPIVLLSKKLNIDSQDTKTAALWVFSFFATNVNNVISLHVTMLYVPLHVNKHVPLHVLQKNQYERNQRVMKNQISQLERRHHAMKWTSTDLFFSNVSLQSEAQKEQKYIWVKIYSKCGWVYIGGGGVNAWFDKFHICCFVSLFCYSMSSSKVLLLLQIVVHLIYQNPFRQQLFKDC